MTLPSPTYELLDDLTIVQEFLGKSLTLCTCTSTNTGLMVLYSLREFDSYHTAHVSTYDGSRTILGPLAGKEEASKKKQSKPKAPRRKKDGPVDEVSTGKRNLFGVCVADLQDQRKGG